VPDETRQTARTLRHNPTRAENALWQRLRQSQESGHKFTRQFPIGPYFADFCCRERMLVVEVDGGQHDEGAAADATRTGVIEARGFRVIRFWNTDVLHNMDGVLMQIAAALEAQA
jgi:very-short-patch-repair endonuclease